MFNPKDRLEKSSAGSGAELAGGSGPRQNSLCLYIKTDMSIFCVVLKITLYHEDVAGMITVKNGAALGRNVHSS